MNVIQLWSYNRMSVKSIISTEKDDKNHSGAEQLAVQGQAKLT